MDAQRAQGLRRLVLGLDALLIAAAMPVALALHGALRGLVPALKEPPAFERYAAVAYLALPVWLALVAAFGLHRLFERGRGAAWWVWGLVKVHAVGLAVLALVIFATKITVNRSLVLLFGGCTFALLLGERALIGLWLRLQHGSGQGRERLLLVGAPDGAMERLVAVAAAEPAPPALVGYLGPPPAAGRDEDAAPLPRWLGTPDEVERVLHEEAVDRVLAFPPHNDAARGHLLEACQTVGVPVAFALDVAPAAAAPPRVATLFDQPFVAYERAPKAAELLAVKHGLDVILAAAGVVLLAPLLLLVSAAILVTMGRPVFFLQERAGLFGRRFRMIKFRTMVRDAEARRGEVAALNEQSGPVFKARGDPRVTPLGRLLRRTSIDELPQLFNVLAGSMSLVGPRPLPREEQQKIRGWHRRRLSMKPGITGLWQVSGRSDVDFAEWMRLDLRYVDGWSLGLDLRILLRTIPAVLAGRGAR